MSDYAPFPEQGLDSLAQYHDDEAKGIFAGTEYGAVHEASAKICRDAIAAHIALRERCLLAELERDTGVKADR